MSIRLNIYILIGDENSSGEINLGELFVQIRASILSQLNPPVNSCKKFLEKIPLIKISKERIEQIKDQNICTVCQEEFKEGSEVYYLHCKHMFHKDCIIPWFETHNTCPTCRFELPLDDQEQEKERIDRLHVNYSENDLKIMDISIQSEYLLNKVQNCVNQDFRELNGCKEEITKSLNDLNCLQIEEKQDATKKRMNDEVLKLKSTEELVDSKLLQCRKKERDENDQEEMKKVKYE